MWCAFSEMLGCGGSASKPASPRDEGSVAEWLDGVGGAWGSKYGAAFVKAGYEDVEDIKTMPPDETIDDAFLKETFAPFGTITSAKIVRDETVSGSPSKGFGFVCFEESEAASKAVEELDGYDKIEDKAWIVCRAQKKAEREAELKAKFDAERRERMEKMAGANLYIKNLEDTTDDAKLRELFAEFGTITSCRVMRDASGARYDTNSNEPTPKGCVRGEHGDVSPRRRRPRARIPTRRRRKLSRNSRARSRGRFFT